MVSLCEDPIERLRAYATCGGCTPSYTRVCIRTVARSVHPPPDAFQCLWFHFSATAIWSESFCIPGRCSYVKSRTKKSPRSSAVPVASLLPDKPCGLWPVHCTSAEAAATAAAEAAEIVTVAAMAATAAPPSRRRGRHRHRHSRSSPRLSRRRNGHRRRLSDGGRLPRALPHRHSQHQVRLKLLGRRRRVPRRYV